MSECYDMISFITHHKLKTLHCEISGEIQYNLNISLQKILKVKRGTIDHGFFSYSIKSTRWDSVIGGGVSHYYYLGFTLRFITYWDLHASSPRNVNNIKVFSFVIEIIYYLYLKDGWWCNCQEGEQWRVVEHANNGGTFTC